MTAKLLRSAACALLLAAAAAAQTASLAGEIAARLTAEALRSDVSFLASDVLKGRPTPSPELDIAAEFIAAQFRRAGLEPAGDEGYFQTADFISYTPDVEGMELSFEIDGRTVVPDKAAVALEDFAAREVRGAKVLKLREDDPAAMTALHGEAARGRALVFESRSTGTAMLALRAALQGSPPPSLIITLSPSPAPTGYGPRLVEASEPVTVPPYPMLRVWDAGVREALAQAREAAVSLRVPAPVSTPVKLRNVAGVLRGSHALLRDTYVLLTAHYDHLGVSPAGSGDRLFNGANDNASGTALVIEIANALASLPARPKRSIVFMTFFGEERGMLGSRYYAGHPLFPLARTVAHVNLEQMGRTDDDSGPRVGQYNVTGFDYTSITEVLRQAGAELDVQVLKDAKRSDLYYSRSDNAALAALGVPAHTLSVGYTFPDYHRPGDEWEKLDYGNMARVARAVALGIYRLADSGEAPQWNKENPRAERYIRAREKILAGK
ncbi:MAG: M28 family peptidase [Bryobacterales bacterium]|nr:M28 family peptidase [Bryobacterales bacterium]